MGREISKNFAHGWRAVVSDSAAASSRSLSTPYTAISIARANVTARESFNSCLPMIPESVWKNKLWPLWDWLNGSKAGVWRDPVGRANSCAALDATDGLTHCLLAALSEDRRGCAIHVLPAVLCTLLALHLALKDHAEISRRFSILHPHAATKLNSFSYPKNFDLECAVAPEVLALTVCIRESLSRLLRTYRDSLFSYSFPSIYAAALEEMVKKL